MRGLVIAALLVLAGWTTTAQTPTQEPQAQGPALTEVQKLTLKDKVREAAEATRLASPEQMAQEIAAFMVARVKNAQEKDQAAMAYYQSLPTVDGYVLTREGEYVKK